MGVAKIRNIEKSGICEGIDVYDSFTIPDEVAEYISRLERAISCCRTEVIRKMYPLLNHYDYSKDPLVELVEAESEQMIREDFQALATEQLEKSENNIL